MYWDETKSDKSFSGSTSIVDVVFRIHCARLPADHAHDLRQAIADKLPWFEEEAAAGIHSIHGAQSGNGWLRPTQEDGGILHLSKRTRLILRIPQARARQCDALCGTTLAVSKFDLLVNDYNLRAIQPTPTLFAHSFATVAAEAEDTFLQRIQDRLIEIGIEVPKMLPGLQREIRLPGNNLRVRSLLFADVNVFDSIRLQEFGLDEDRKLGCGLFLPHKAIAPVNPA